MNAGGQAIVDYGKCKVDIVLDTTCIQSEVVIAEIHDEVLLGMDILKGANKKPADIILSQNKIILNGKEIRCQNCLPINSRKVRAADNYVLQGHTEQIIDAFIERCESDDNLNDSSFLIEPSESFKQNFALVMASSLADINFAPTVKVRIMNPFPTEASIRANTVIGSAEQLLCEPVPILKNEEQTATDDNSSVRRLQFMQTDKSSICGINVMHDHKQPAKEAEKTISPQKIPEYLQSVCDEASKGRKRSEKQQIASLLSEYQDIFSRDENDLGLTSLAEHTIDTGDSRPIKQPFRRVPLAFADEEKKAIDKLVKQGVIRPSSSPWASPLCLVRKKDGSVRPCVDYRQLNKVTKPDAFPVPKADECIDAVSGAKIFSTIDLTSGYFQVPVKREDIPKTAFTSKHGLYEFTSTPFGMINSGATFQRVMELALKGLQWHICIIYIDDCIIFSTTFEEHLERLKLVFQRFREANLKLKPKKCELLKKEVTFLGFRVSGEGGVRPDPNNVSKVLQWPVPANVTEVKQFLGLCSYYRKHVKNFSMIAKPLFDLTKKDSKLVWTDDSQISFNQLKAALTSNEIMALPSDKGGQFILDVDACNYGIGAVLSQVQDGKEKVVSYASRTLNRAETNYCVTDKELLAIRYFVEYFRHYLLGRHFTVRSDHSALKWLFSLKSPTGRIARWIEILSGYDFDVEYRKGTLHGNADAMSRCRNPKDCSCSDIDTEESLKCGPCNKCLKRAEQMESTLQMNTTKTSSTPIHDISRLSMSSKREAVKNEIPGFACLAIKHACLFLLVLATILQGANSKVLQTDVTTSLIISDSQVTSHGSWLGLAVGFSMMVLLSIATGWIYSYQPEGYVWLGIQRLFGRVKERIMDFALGTTDLKWLVLTRSGCVYSYQPEGYVWLGIQRLFGWVKESVMDFALDAAGLKWSLLTRSGYINRYQPEDHVWLGMQRFFCREKVMGFALDTIGWCRSVLTRSGADVVENWLPWSSGYTMKELQDMQKDDVHIGPIIQWFSSGVRPEGSIAASASPETRHYLLCWNALVLKNGILMRKFEKKDGSGTHLQLLTPSVLKNDVLYQMHNGVLSGHLGRKKTREKVLQRYYWYKAREDVNLWIANCDNCGANKPPPFKPRAPLGSMPVGAPLDRLSTDLIGALPRTPRGNRYILVVTDQFTKWVEIFAIPDQSAETTARTILNEVIARYGSPTSIHSDQGANYESRIFRELCSLLEIKKSRTSVRNPKGNGQTERFNKTLIHMVRAYLSDQQSEWDLNLGCLAAAYRATPNESTKMTPNLLMLGRENRIPAEVAFGSSTASNDTVSSYSEYVQKLKNNLQKAHTICRDNLKESAKRHTEIYDNKQMLHTYKKGDLVWFLRASKKDAICSKLLKPYIGPYPVKEKLSNQNYVLAFSKEGKSQVVHHDKLKPYQGSNPPKWVLKMKESLSQ